MPARRPAEAGSEIVAVTVDAVSLDASYFGASETAFRAAQAYQRELTGLAHPHALAQVIGAGLGQYQAVFVPGGPAPTVDLMASPELGTILRYFHAHQRLSNEEDHQAAQYVFKGAPLRDRALITGQNSASDALPGALRLSRR